MASVSGARRLEGKTALITGTGGGSRGGIGRAAAIVFAEQGAKIVGCDIDSVSAARTVELVTRAGGEMKSLHPLDLSDEQSIARLIEFASRSYGAFDILLNNAAMFKRCNLDTVTREDWSFSVDNELTLMLMAAKAAVPILSGRKGANIVNVGSTAGTFGHGPGALSHNVMKAAVLRLTELLAIECASRSVRVNAVSPGPTASPDRNDVERNAYFAKSTLMNRLVPPRDIALAAAFLASEDAASITGANLVVDAGHTISGGQGTAIFPTKLDY